MYKIKMKQLIWNIWQLKLDLKNLKSQNKSLVNDEFEDQRVPVLSGKSLGSNDIEWSKSICRNFLFSFK